ncbi:hypothetical protein COCON_G00018530 [Conger conger]|uniref:Ig-like domain-containing protein n=1 Tax=Conger conger TaxID=82655 RepID=A0A9Q1E4G6_CONCO|nr:hypothetical protein COCON_G00018530 [Conger conger]
MPLHSRRALKHTCLGVLLSFLMGGVVDGQLTVTVPSPSTVAKVGRNKTLGVEYTGAVDPTVVWLKDGETIVTWTLGSIAPPQISAEFDTVLIERNGSLTIRDVQLKHGGEYKVVMFKPDMGRDEAKFALRVFDDFESVSVSAVPAKIKEGADTFSLSYSTGQGEAQSVKWSFDGQEITNGTRHTIVDNRLTVKSPTRNDTGQYTLVLTNPFSSATVVRNITVLYGPDEPVLKIRPQKNAFELGDSLLLSCASDGVPAPTVSWVFGGLTLPVSQGTLNLTNVQTHQSGVYTCLLVNAETGTRLRRNFTINIFERPSGSLMCSVGGNATEDLQFRCRWPGGAPEAQLSFPALNGSVSGSGDLNLTVTPTPSLSGREIVCTARHPLLQQNCSVTARSHVINTLSVPSFQEGRRACRRWAGGLVVTISCAAGLTWSAVVATPRCCDP